LTNLEILKINRCNVVYTTAQSADFLANDIPRVKDIAFVTSLPKLRELHLKGNALSDISSIVSSLPALEYLELGKDRFTPAFAKIESAKGIATLTSLTKLNLAGNLIFGDALSEVALMEGLVQLDLENNNIKDVSVLGTLSALVPSNNAEGKLINPLRLFGNPIARTVSKDDQSCIKTPQNCPTSTASEALNLFCSGLTSDGKGNCL
jgi:Leucine-rich repeat (LRR) protein